MMRACGSDESNELIAYLKSKFEIPENTNEIILRIAVDEVITVTCTYAPNFKDAPKLCRPVTG